jgi:hypothetical protein
MPARKKATKKKATKKKTAKKKTTKKKKTKKKAPSKKGGTAFSQLEKNILMAKGVTEAALKKMISAGIRKLEDFRTVGDAITLKELTGLASSVAAKVMEWATGGGAGGKVVVESADSVHCVTCGKKQPTDFKSGDLCVYCGKQAEPVFSCYWCAGSGPGKFCRSCGAVFVPPGELELAILLKQDGLSKEEIPDKLKSLSPAEKEALWGRVRARR